MNISRQVACLSLGLIATFALAKSDLTGFDGTWIYVEDRTPGRTLEQLGPPMSSTFSVLTEPGAVILVSGHGSGQKNVRITFDGTITEAQDGTTTLRYTATWQDGVLAYRTAFFRGPEKTPDGAYLKEFRMTPEGMVVTVNTGRSVGIGLYRQAKDIPMPTPAKATINDLAWLTGTWSGARGTNNAIKFEERWTPPMGGSMMATARTVNTSGRLSAFEYLRILEREGGLVYIAQPGGAAPTEFVLTEFSATRAVFENPRHDYPKKIIYELGEGGKLTATIGFLKGGTPRKFEFTRQEVNSDGS